jgi:hypothetical protein
MKKIILSIPILLLFATQVIAAPVISTGSGVAANGNSYTISGSTFGTKTTAAPLLFETFEDGTDNTELGNSKWIDTDTNKNGWYDNTRAYSGSLSAFNDVGTGAEYDLEFGTSYTNFTPCDNVYISYKYYFNADLITGTVYSAQKLSRSNTEDAIVAHYSGPGSMEIACNGIGETEASYGTGLFFAYDPGDGGGFNIDYFTEPIPQDQWVHIEMYKENSDAGVANGSYYATMVGIDTVSASSLVTMASGQDFQQKDFLLGLMCANLEERGTALMEMWIDDVVIDNTESRVVLGNDSVYANCTVLDYQPQTAHSATDITITFNQGQFTVGQTAYLYVIDENGLVSNSLAVEIGAGVVTYNVITNTTITNGIIGG